MTSIFIPLLLTVTSLTLTTKANEGGEEEEEEIAIKSYNLTSQDGHDSPTLVKEKTHIGKPGVPKCGELPSKLPSVSKCGELVQGKGDKQSDLDAGSVKGWTIFLYVCLALILFAIVVAIAYKSFRDKSPNIFERIHPGIQVQEPNKPIHSGKNTIIQVWKKKSRPKVSNLVLRYQISKVWNLSMISSIYDMNSSNSKILEISE